MDEAEDIIEQYKCAICQEVWEEPIQIKTCAHSFCKECIKALTRVSLPSPKKGGKKRGGKQPPVTALQQYRCPSCTLPFRIPDLNPNAKLSKEMDGISYACMCSEMYPLSKLKSHMKECEKYGKFVKDVEEHGKQEAKDKEYVNRSTFNCPYCQKGKNLVQRDLVTHIINNHKGVSGVCPICVVMPWGDPNYISKDLVGHLKLRHKYDVSHYTDFNNTDDDIVKQIMLKSMGDY